MFESGVLRELASLDLASCAPRIDEVGALAGLPGLKHLYLRRANVGPTHAERLADVASSLESLDLMGTHTGDAGLRLLADPERSQLGGLRTLELRNAGLTDASVVPFAKGVGLPGLRQVTLSGEGIREASFTAFAEGPRLRQLDALRIAGFAWRIDPGVVRRLEHAAADAGCGLRLR